MMRCDWLLALSLDGTPHPHSQILRLKHLNSCRYRYGGTEAWHGHVCVWFWIMFML